jgi:hypothetical protein
MLVHSSNRINIIAESLQPMISPWLSHLRKCRNSAGLMPSYLICRKEEPNALHIICPLLTKPSTTYKRCCLRNSDPSWIDIYVSLSKHTQPIKGFKFAVKSMDCLNPGVECKNRCWISCGCFLTIPSLGLHGLLDSHRNHSNCVFMAFVGEQLNKILFISPNLKNRLTS